MSATLIHAIGPIQCPFPETGNCYDGPFPALVTPKTGPVEADMNPNFISDSISPHLFSGSIEEIWHFLVFFFFPLGRT